MNIFLSIIFFILGLSVGSFVNMAIYRTNKKLNFFGTSYCDYCKKPLKFLDLIPLFSFIYTKGRSRCCNKKLDCTMPFVELITAISFVFLYLNYSSYIFLSANRSLLEFIFYALIIPLLIFLFFYDLKFFELPVIPVVLLYIFWFVYKFLDYNLVILNNNIIKNASPIGEYLVKSGYFVKQVDYFYSDTLYTIGFAFFTFLFFLFLFIFTKGKGMGFGDVYFAPALALIAYYPLSPIFLASSFIVGAIFGVTIILFKGKNLKTAVPFGPFLIIGLLIALTFGKMYINL